MQTGKTIKWYRVDSLDIVKQERVAAAAAAALQPVVLMKSDLTTCTAFITNRRHIQNSSVIK
jgi:hypothetical protein